MVSNDADVAYHFHLGNEDEYFEEGEVVAFVPVDTGENEKSAKKLAVKKMSVENAKQCPLKGVITRSFYFEARKPLTSK